MSVECSRESKALASAPALAPTTLPLQLRLRAKGPFDDYRMNSMTSVCRAFNYGILWAAYRKMIGSR
jgi:hypothetical protein